MSFYYYKYLAEETGVLLEELGVELMLKGLNEKLDPGELEILLVAGWGNDAGR